MDELSKHILDLSKDFILIPDPTIPSGAYGTVVKAQDKRTNKLYAIKYLINYHSSPIDQVNFLREVEILASIHHPTIVSFHGFTLSDPTNHFPAIVTEFMSGGSLFTIMRAERNNAAPKGWDITQKMIVLYGIAVGMNHLHSHNIIHRDLKPGNVLLSNKFEPAITDFGLSKIGEDNSSQPQSICGTPQWMAPEVIAGKNYTNKVDVYSYAMIIYELLTLQIPFGFSPDQSTLNHQIINGIRPNIDSIVNNSEYSKMIQLMKLCWNQEPNQRPSFQEIVTHFSYYIPDTTNMDRFQKYVNSITINDAHNSSDHDFSKKKNTNYKPSQKEKELLNLKHKADLGDINSRIELGKHFMNKEPFPNSEFMKYAKEYLSNSDEGQYILGKYYLDNNQYEEAYAILKECLNSPNPFPGSLFEIGMGYYHRKENFFDHQNQDRPEKGLPYIITAAQYDWADAVKFLYDSKMMLELADIVQIKGIKHTNALQALSKLYYELHEN